MHALEIRIIFRFKSCLKCELYITTEMPLMHNTFFLVYMIKEPTYLNASMDSDIYKMHIQQNRCFVSHRRRRPSDVETHLITVVST